MIYAIIVLAIIAIGLLFTIVWLMEEKTKQSEKHWKRLLDMQQEFNEYAAGVDSTIERAYKDKERDFRAMHADYEDKTEEVQKAIDKAKIDMHSAYYLVMVEMYRHLDSLKSIESFRHQEEEGSMLEYISEEIGRLNKRIDQYSAPGVKSFELAFNIKSEDPVAGF